MVFVPRSALLTLEDVPSVLQDKIGNVRVHGLLAAFLAFGPSEERALYSTWMKTWPTMENLQEEMPILWPSSTHIKQRSLVSSRRDSFCALPYAVSGISFFDDESERHQGTRLPMQEMHKAQDWAIIARGLPSAKYSEFLYYWLIVNTRSFYYELPSKGKAQARADLMALCPFIDYFNHADHGVSQPNAF